MKSTAQIAAVFLVAMTPAAGRAQSGAGADPFGELSGVVLSLLIVVCAILAAAWVLRRTPLAAANRKSGPLKLVATLPLGPKERLLLVEADGCEVLIGVSPAGIFPLHRTAHDGDPAPESEARSRHAPASFARSMDPAALLGDPL